MPLTHFIRKGLILEFQHPIRSRSQIVNEIFQTQEGLCRFYEFAAHFMTYLQISALFKNLNIPKATGANFKIHPLPTVFLLTESEKFIQLRALSSSPSIPTRDFTLCVSS